MKKKLILPILLSVFLASCTIAAPNGGKKKKTSSEDSSTSTTLVSGSSTSGSSVTSGSSGSSGTSGTSSTSDVDPELPVVTKVTLNTHAESVKQGASITLSATVTGKNNPAKTLTWETSNSNYATVSNGVVSVKSTATAGQTVTITARSTVTTSVTDSCVITVLSASASESYTILIYMCGADLESSHTTDQYEGFASGDLREIASVASILPNNFNIVVETGGASKWASNPGIDKNYLQRRKLNSSGTWEVISNETKANMGLQSTLQSFLSWGLTTYPADHTGVIMWNHGGAAMGCCFDENYSDDGIRPSEMDGAVKNALSSAGKSGQKLDWVGYDCCIMSYADLASINSQYFKYMVSSQELESGLGWDYDAWLPTLFSNTSISTETILTKICTTFVSENGGSSSSNDQCLSVLNLQNFGTFQTAFESFASGLTSTNWSKIKSSYTSSLRFGNLDEYGGAMYGYGLADMKDFLTKAANNGFNTSAASSALSNVLVHSSYGGFYSSTKPCGLNIFVPADDDGSPQISEDDYGASDTKFTNWRSFVIENGTFYGSGGGGGWDWNW